MDTSFDSILCIRSKSDMQLLKEVYWDNGIPNSFGESCLMSDKYTQETGHVTHFIEAAIVDHQEVLLYVMKKPRYSADNQFVGTAGIAWDLTAFSGLVMPMLETWLQGSKIEILYQECDVFCYAIKPSVLFKSEFTRLGELF